MPVVETRYEHVILNEDNVPVVAGANMKVVELLLRDLEPIAKAGDPEDPMNIVLFLPL